MPKNYPRKTVQYSKHFKTIEDKTSHAHKLNWNERSSALCTKSHAGICFDYWECIFFVSPAPVDAFRMRVFGNAMLGTPFHVHVFGNLMSVSAFCIKIFGNGAPVSAFRFGGLEVSQVPSISSSVRVSRNVALIKFCFKILGIKNAGKRPHNIKYRWKNKSRAFQIYKWMFCDNDVSMAFRFQLFNVMLTSVLCLASGHCKLQWANIAADCYDVWSRQMSIRICHGTFACLAQSFWPAMAWNRSRPLAKYLKFAKCAALLPKHRWIK